MLVAWSDTNDLQSVLDGRTITDMTTTKGTTMTTYTINNHLISAIQNPVVESFRPLTADEIQWMQVWDAKFVDENGAYVMASGEVVTWTKFADVSFDNTFTIENPCSVAVTIFETDGSVTEYGAHTAPIERGK